jgi:hypothetical protein
MVVEALRELFADGAIPHVSGLNELVEVRQLMDRLDAVWLTGLTEAVRNGGVQEETGLSPTDFFAHRCRRTRAEAGGWLTFAKRLAATSMIGPRFADGSLSMSQAREFSRVRTKRTAELFDEHEAGLLDAGDELPVDQLSTLMSQWYRRADAATAHRDGEEVEQARELVLLPVGDSEWMLRGTLTPEQGEVVSDAIDAVSQAEWDKAAETRSLAQRRADALATIARFWLDNQNRTTVHGQRPHVQVIIDYADLAHEHTSGGADTDDDGEDGAEPRWMSSGRYTPPSEGTRRRGGGRPRRVCGSTGQRWNGTCATAFSLAC